MFSVLQALIAMGSQMEECGSAMEALRADLKKGTYHNPMAISQVLPALHQRTYLHLKSQECRNENGLYNLHASSIKYCQQNWICSPRFSFSMLYIICKNSIW